MSGADGQAARGIGAGWIAAVLLTCAGPAAAQQVPIDTAAVDACFQTAPRGRIDPDCIGLAARACQAGTQATTIGTGQCVTAETAAWDTLLNREYQATRDAYADMPALADTLREAQRAWITLRDADCAFAYDRHGGGSIRSIDAAYCQLEHTARRTLQLRNMRDN